MLVSEVEDLVRATLGVPDMSPTILALYRKLARSEVESKGNFYWQAASVDVTIPVAGERFDVEVDFLADDFLEFRFIALQKNSKWRFIFPGSWQATLEGVDPTATGFPERATFENKVLQLSPITAEEIEGRMFYFAATEEPEATGTDSVYTDFPQLMLFATLATATRLTNKDGASAKMWDDLAQEQIDKAIEYTKDLLGEPSGQISASSAAKILQAQVGK